MTRNVTNIVRFLESCTRKLVQHSPTRCYHRGSDRIPGPVCLQFLKTVFCFKKGEHGN